MDMAEELVGVFGDGGGMPTAAQWRAMAEGPDGPVCVMNLVKLKPQADYGPGADEPARSGLEALMQYGAGSNPRIAALGGTVAAAGLTRGVIVGRDEDWDVGIVVNWPSRAAMLALYRDEAYQAAFRHRRAAVERYRAVMIGLQG